MITSRAGKKHRDRGKQAGANAYLSKPYKESELIDEVRKLLRNRDGTRWLIKKSVPSWRH